MAREYRAALERSVLDRERPLVQLVGDEVRFRAERAEAFMKSIVPDWGESICAFYHMLCAMKRKTIKCIAKELMQKERGEGEREELVPPKSNA